jgi:sialate O-acetylesterase
VEGSWSKRTVETIAGQKGRWILFLPTVKAGGPYKITIQGKNTITLSNVLLGEVWLCSGQSNMEFPMSSANYAYTGVVNADQEIRQADYPNLRMFSVAKKPAAAPLEEVGGTWKITTPATVGKFSAVAYYFGKELMDKLGVPVGLIETSWSGTTAEVWTSGDVLKSDSDFVPIVDRYNKALDNYNKALEIYAEQKQKGDTILAMPKQPLDVRQFTGPSQLYNSMLHPLIPYSLKGVVWYQGESNSPRSYQYRKLLPALIQSWRKEWKQDFPFYLVQIAPFMGYIPEIREAQLITYRSVPKTGIVVLTDAGDSSNNHPKNKSIVGKRLALWALAKDYGNSKLSFSGPLYKSYKIEGNKIRISFDFADGLQFKNGMASELVIAGPNRQFIPAAAKIEGNTIVVWSDNISDPAAVRFGWKNVPHAELYNKGGLPASPFRTDDWPAETFNRR